MDSNRMNKASQIIEIEEDDVIDLDGTEKTPEEVIYEWDAKIRKKLSVCTVADNEIILRDVMKEYLKSLQDMTHSYEDNETLKNKVYCHISFFYSYYVELQCCTPDNYLSHMEDILTLYSNLQLEVVGFLKKKDFTKHKYTKQILAVAKHMIRALTVFLLDRQDHILHVLIKMNTNKVSDSCAEVLKVLYTHFLTKVPVYNLCDESFCRNYIVFQKWKEIRKVEEWETMDKIMYKMFKRTPESIKNSDTLRQILMPACQSTVDIVMNLFRSFRAISNAYFKHVVAKRNVDFDDLDFNIDLGEDEPTIPANDDNEEEVQFMKAFFEVERNMSNLAHSSVTSDIDIFNKCKVECDEDDDVLFVGYTVLSPPQVIEVPAENESRHDVTNAIETSTPPPVRLLTPPPVRPPTPPPSHPPSTPPTHPPAQPPATPPAQRSATPPAQRPATPPAHPPTPPPPIHPCPLPAASPPATIPTPPPRPKTPETFENLNGLNRIHLSHPPVSCPPAVSSPEPEVAFANKPIVVETKSVEVQAENYVYNDYGLTTPPFEVTSEEQSEPRMYADIPIGQKEGKGVATRSVEVQVEVDSQYDYGLTPPNENHDDHNGRGHDTCIYANLKNLTKEHETLAEFDDHDHSDVHNESETDEIDVESCPDPEIRLNPDLEIDTGQEKIMAPNIPPVTAEDSETFNGNTVLKPLSNRTNGQAKDVPSPVKIMYTSAQKIKPPLDDFTRFEMSFNNGEWSGMKENHGLDEIMSGPVSKTIQPKLNILSSQDKIEIFGHDGKNNSRSSSPTEMTSPAYEAIDDFRTYYVDNVNGRVPPPRDAKVPQGILKKGNSSSTTRRKNHRIIFHESTCDPPEVKRSPPRGGVVVPKRIKRDQKLNMCPTAVLKRLPEVENALKMVHNNPPTLRVDYDKSTTFINKNDVVRCISPPKLTWIVSRHNPDSLTVKNLEHLEKKPKKRKYETQAATSEPNVRKRGRPRRNL